MNQNYNSVPTWLRFIVIIAIVAGIGFRFVHLDRKIFWFDEVINSIHTSGHSKKEYSAQVKKWSGKYITISDFHDYQYPNNRKNSFDVVKSLAIREPQSTPLYYILGHWWERLFGESVAIKRSLSAAISLLAFPGIYWLCLELFESSLTGWIAVALIAISPFHILFAQEVRPFGLWSVTILLSSVTFLRAMRLNTLSSWGMYSISSVLAYYTFPLSLLVVIGHGIYAIVLDFDRILTGLKTRFLANVKKPKIRFYFSIDIFERLKIKPTKRVLLYLYSSAIALLVFSPWLFFIAQINSEKMGSWRKNEISFFTLVKTWFFNASQIILDVYRKYTNTPSSILENGVNSFQVFAALLGVISIWIIIFYCLYYVCAYAPKKIQWFILTLIFTTALALIVPDLVLGGRRSAISRYFFAPYLGIHLLVAYVIAQKALILKLDRLQKNIWRFILIVFLQMEILSCAIISREQYWWTKNFNYSNIPTVRIINQSSSPVLAGNTDWWFQYNVLSLSYHLKKSTKILFLPLSESPSPDTLLKLKQCLEENNSLFLFVPNLDNMEPFIQKHNYKSDLVYSQDNFTLWKLSKSRTL